MKFRFDFVTNSSSSSFVAYGIYDEKLAKKVKKLLESHDPYPSSTIGCISVDNNVISVTRELSDVDPNGYYNIHELLEDDFDGRNDDQKAEDEEQALTTENIISALKDFFGDQFLNKETKKLIAAAVEEEGVECRVWADQTDGYDSEDFSYHHTTLKNKRAENRARVEANTVSGGTYNICPNIQLNIPPEHIVYKGDDENYFTVCGYQYFNDKGEESYKNVANAAIEELDVLDEDVEKYPNASRAELAVKQYLRAEGTKVHKLNDSPYIAILNLPVKLTIIENILSVDTTLTCFLIEISKEKTLTFHYSNKVKGSDDEEHYEHVLEVLRALVVNGSSIDLGGLTAKTLMNKIKIDFDNIDSDKNESSDENNEGDKYTAISDHIGMDASGKKRVFCVDNEWTFEVPKSYKYKTDDEIQNKLVEGGFDITGSVKPLIIRSLKRESGEYLLELVLNAHRNMFGKEYDMDDLRYDDRADTKTDGVVRHEIIRDDDDFVVDLSAKSIFPFGSEYEIRVRGENISPYNFTVTIPKDSTEDEVEKLKKTVKEIAKTIKKAGNTSSAVSTVPKKKESKKITVIDDPNFVISGTVVKKYKSNSAHVIIPQGVTEIADNAFYGKSLETVTFPNGLKSIGDNAFAGCDNLTAVVLPDSVEELGSRSFENCFSIEYVKLSSSLKYVGSYSFVDAHELSYLEIPEGVETIGNSAFSDCRSLKELVLPSTIKTLDAFAFKGCSSLTKVILPQGVETIGFTAFAWNDRMTYLYVPKTVKNIYDNLMGQSPFQGCSSLTIYGHSGSEIEKYARSHGIKFSAVTSAPKATLTKVAPPSNSAPQGIDDSAVESLMDSLADIQSSLENILGTLEEAENEAKMGLNVKCRRPKYKIPEEEKYYVSLDECEMDGTTLVKFEVEVDKPYLVFPKGIEVVGYSAIESEYIKGIIFSEGLKTIEGSMVFWNRELEYIYLPSTFRATDDTIFFGLNADKFKYFDVSEDNEHTLTIDGALYYRDEEEGFTLGEVPSGWKEFCLPACVVNISREAFDNSYFLEKITVEEGSARYFSVDNLLCEKDDKENTVLLTVPGGLKGKFTVPDEIDVIATRAFNTCNKLTEVVLSKNVKEVKYGAFGVTDVLAVVDVPSMTTEFPENAKYFNENSLKWTIHCIYTSKADKVAKKKGWAVDYSRYEKETQQIRDAEEKARIAAEEKRKAEEKARLEAEAKRKAEEERRREEARRAEEERKAREARIAEERRLAEEARKAEEARIAEERRLKKEKRIKTLKKVAIISAIPIVLILALVIVLATVVFPNIAYKNAEKLFAEGKYEQAESLYAYLGDHEDSEIKLTIIRSVSNIEDGNYGDAIEALLDIGISVTVSYDIENDATLMASAVMLLSTSNNDVNTFTYTNKEAFDGMKSPSRVGYQFAEWSLVSYNYNEDKTFNLSLSSEWDVETYEINIDLDGGTAINRDSYTIEDATFSLVNPTKTGYTFIGWSCNNSEALTMTATIAQGSNGNISYVAKWNANDYTINLDAAGGTVSSNSVSVKYDATYTLPTPTLKGHTFQGWYNGNTKVEDGTYIKTQDLKLVAKWTANQYKVSFDDVTIQKIQVKVTLDYNGADEDKKDIVLYAGDKLTSALVGRAYRSDYIFRGWFLDKECTQLYKFNTSISDDLTLYAGWQEDANHYNMGFWMPKQDGYYQFDVASYNSSQNCWEYSWGYYSSSVTYIYISANEGGTHRIYYYCSSRYVKMLFRAYNLTKKTLIDGDSWKENYYGGHQYFEFNCDEGDMIAITVDRNTNFYSSLEVSLYFEGFTSYASNVASVDIPEGEELAYNESQSYEETVTFGNVIDLPVPVRKGYTFDGWYYNDKKVEDGEWNFDEDATLEARWIPNS